MDNKIVIGLVIGAIALLALAIFATNPTGQAMLKYATTTLPTPATSFPYTTTMWITEYATVSVINSNCQFSYLIDNIMISTNTKSPDTAKFKVNGETSNSLKKGESYIFMDKSYVSVLKITPAALTVSKKDMVQISFTCPVPSGYSVKI